MRLCFLAPANSSHSHRWIRFFAERGHEIHWLSLHESMAPPMPGIRYHERVVRGVGSMPARVRWAARLIREIRPDVLHIHSAGTYGALGALAAPRTALPVVLTAWGSDVLFAGRHPIKRYFVRRALRRADVITVDAQHMVDAITAMGLPAEKIRIVNFGVETDWFRPGERDAGLRSGWGAGPDDMVAISLRSLEPIYDIPTLIRAVPLVRSRNPALRFVIGGDGGEAARLKSLAAELGVSEAVHFMGRYDHDTLPRLLSSVDAYVSTALSDAGIAASTAEAMACGVPAVVSDTGENRLWIETGRNGILVPPSDSPALADALVRLLSDPAAAKRMGMAGRETIVKRNDYQGEMAKVENIYMDLAGAGRR